MFAKRTDLNERYASIHKVASRHSVPEGKAVAKPPPPLRRNGVDSPHLPACMLHAPGDPAVIAPEEGR